MTRLFNLEDLVDTQKSFEIQMLNSSGLNCTHYNENLKYKTRVVRQFFQYLAPIILTLGIIGNSLGLYCAMKDNVMYIRVYLTRVFHAVNLFNAVFMLLYPILDMIGESYLLDFVNQLPWNLYLVKYHFSMAKTLLNFAFGIYVIFGISQMIAIVYPHYYKRFITLRRIKIMLAISFLYYLAWYIPSAWWFELLKFSNVCGLETKIIYTRIFASFTKMERTRWIIFGFFRETFTRFIPVAIILVLNFFSLKHKKLKLRWRLSHRVSNLPETSISNMARGTNISAVVDGNIKNELRDNIFQIAEPSKLEYNVAPITNSSNIIPSKNSRVGCNSKFIQDSKLINNIPSRTDSQGQRKIMQRELEYKISIRMLAILMLEFLVFLFPVSIYLTTVDFFDYLLTTGESDIAFAGCTMLEYSYISLTFYLNMIFNPAYREDVIRVLKKSWFGKFCYKMQEKFGRC
ncbi:unnamed protein product [Gordionus sp. m RMFG-2023]